MTAAVPMPQRMTTWPPTSMPAEAAPGANTHVSSRLDWRFLLPQMPGGAVLVIGQPAPALLAGLAATPRQIIVAHLGPLSEAAHSLAAPGVPIVCLDPAAPLPFRARTFDVAITVGRAAMSHRSASALFTSLRDVLRPDGVIYVEASGLGDPYRARRVVRELERHGVWSGDWYWLVHRAGALRAAIPMRDASTLSGYFFSNVLYGRSRIGRLAKPALAWLARRRLLHHAIPARAVVLRAAPDTAPAPQPFPYLVRIARQHGMELGTHRSALLAHGSYDSNKVAVYFFDRAANTPDVIVKMTRTPVFNPRLETEYAALRRLHTLELADAGTYPEAMFLAEHGGLAVLAQRVIEGVPFRVRTSGRPDCPLAADAVQWLTQLATRSATYEPAAARTLARRFSLLLEQVDALYGLAADERGFLEGCIASLGAQREPVPIVCRHGDSGTWNILATRDGRAAFIDWEVSEPLGPPLWDLFYFVRSFGTWLGRLGGGRDAAQIYQAAFLADGPMAALQRDSVRRYCARVGLSPALIAPLFYTCWMKSAVHEAAWTTGALADGRYIRLLRLCIRERRAPGLAWMLD